MFEMEVLGDFFSTGTIAAGNTYRPSAASGNGELDSNEVAEVVYMEIYPPVNAGTPEDLEQIQLVLDGKTNENGNIIGTDTHNMFPPTTNILNNDPLNNTAPIILNFGMPMIDAMNTSAPLLRATCPKLADTVTVRAVAGSSGINVNFRIRLWGYRYERDQLEQNLGQNLGGTVSINDSRNLRTLSFEKDNIPITHDNWTQLPGGLDQKVPKITKLIRYAFNANPTTANIPYQFRFDTGNTQLEEENMRFEFDRFNDALLIERFGIRDQSGNLFESFISVDGEDRPESRIPTTQNNNSILFGQAQPLLAASSNLYYPLKRFDKSYLVWNDIGYVAAVDDGTPVPANNMIAGISGILIEDLPN